MSREQNNRWQGDQQPNASRDEPGGSVVTTVGAGDWVDRHFPGDILSTDPSSPRPPKAMTATARNLAVLIYDLLTNQDGYKEPDMTQYRQRAEKQKIIRLMKQAQELGYQLVPSDQAQSAA
jgi:hypothetical protein